MDYTAANACSKSAIISPACSMPTENRIKSGAMPASVGRDVSVNFMDRLKLAAIVTHVADARTCVLHPASHTHRQMTDEQLTEAGIAPDLIRFSVGIEHAGDIIHIPLIL